MLHALSGKRIWICTLGCRSNQYEGEALANALTESGAILSDTPECDAAVLVSCTVTAVADKKCRQAIRRARRTSPGAIIVACGCWAQNLPENEARSLGIRLLVGNRRKWHLPALLAEAFESHDSSAVEAGARYREDRGDVLGSKEWDDLFLAKPLLHTRAFVKIQDGCNHFCSYCAIPEARGFPVSRRPEDVVEEVRSIVSSGCSEVVLTGVHLGLYGKYGEISLAGLVRMVASVEGVRRLRFGSIEPLGIDDELLEALSSTPAFQPHLHIPLQSGNAHVLSLMNRGYSPSDFLGLLRRVRTFFGPEIHISTDLLVGFPGESGSAFEETLSFLEECGFGKVHVFPFSPRKGTKAFSLPGRIPPDEISARSRRALELGSRMLRSYCALWTGRDLPVLVEQVRGAAFQGLTPSFLRVTGRGSASCGQEVSVRITGAGNDVLKGRILA